MSLRMFLGVSANICGVMLVILWKWFQKKTRRSERKIISGLNFRIDRTYIDAAWSVLEKNGKYALLLNQTDAYGNEELPVLRKNG